MSDPKRSRDRRIPDFATREEEAAWWDSHSITDYLDELEPVEVKFAKSLSNGETDVLDCHGGTW